MSALTPYLNDPTFLSLLFSSTAFIISLVALLWVFLRPDRPSVIYKDIQEEAAQDEPRVNHPPATIEFKEHSHVFGEKADSLTKQSYRLEKSEKKTKFL